MFCAAIPAVGDRVILEERESSHLFKVLRARSGERFAAIDGSGTAAVIEIRDREAVVVERQVRNPEKRAYWMFFALPRRNKIDNLLTQAAETGVRHLVPIRFSRGVSDAEPSDRWRLHLIEGCKQSHNPFLPVVHPAMALDKALDEAEKEGVTLFYGDVSGDGREISAVGDAGWIVGPEGGFTPDEENLMRRRGARPLNLGPYVLRLETAACCGIAVLRRILGGLLLGFSLLFLLTGCGGGDEKIERNPLYIKAEKQRYAGDAEASYRTLLLLLEKHPRSAALHLAVANLCDEFLNRGIEAIYHYDVFLNLAPADSPKREAVREYRRLAVARFIATGAATGGTASDTGATIQAVEVEKLKKEVNMLRQQNQAFRKYFQRLAVRRNPAPAQKKTKQRIKR